MRLSYFPSTLPALPSGTLCAASRNRSKCRSSDGSGQQPIGICPRMRDDLKRKASPWRLKLWPLAACPFFVVEARRGAGIRWPRHALEEGGAVIDYDAMSSLDSESELTDLADAAGRAVGGSWSIDI